MLCGLNPVLPQSAFIYLSVILQCSVSSLNHLPRKFFATHSFCYLYLVSANRFQKHSSAQMQELVRIHDFTVSRKAFLFPQIIINGQMAVKRDRDSVDDFCHILLSFLSNQEQ